MITALLVLISDAAITFSASITALEGRRRRYGASGLSQIMGSRLSNHSSTSVIGIVTDGVD